jgi:Asp-tRNA(Asn)/Glu-tRNA(Gln) amidotransferase C subunit
MPNALREDEVVTPPGHESLLKNAPDREGVFFKVPKIGD